MKKITIFILFSLLGLQISNAQLRFKLGTNITTLTESNNVFANSGYLVRPVLGVIGRRIELGGSTYITPEFLLTWKGQRYKETFELTNSNDTRYVRNSKYKNKFTYFEMPFIFNSGLSDNLMLEFGPSVGLRFSGKREGETIVTTYLSDGSLYQTVNVPENFKYKEVQSATGDGAKRPLNSFDFGLNVGLKYTLESGITIGGRYNFGLIDVTKNNFPIQSADKSWEVNQTFTISASYEFN